MLSELIKNKDVKIISKTLFDVNLALTQEKIVRAIAYSEHKRVVINSMTRYGKSFSISLGVLLYILFNENKKIIIVSPTYLQSRIVMNYIADNLIKSSIFVNLVEFEAIGAERLKKQVTKSRITFKNGCELQMLSAEGKAQRLMGFGAGLVILDESALIPYEVYQERISRMLGDDSESMLVEIGNPFDKNNQFFRHWTDPKFHKIHIDYKKAIEEGRATTEFIEEQRADLLSLQFRILYEAEFPDEAEDQLFPEKALQKMLYLPEIDDAHFLKNPCTKKMLGIDVARFGVDLTVLTTIEKRGDIDYITNINAYEKKDTMATVGYTKKLHEKENFHTISVDDCGVGSGVTDRLNEVITNCEVIPFIAGASPTEEKERYLNLKAFWYSQLVDRAKKGKVKILNNEHRGTLLTELRGLKYEFTSNGKMKIVKDPSDKSPDFADSLNIGMFEGSTFLFDFV